MTGVRKVKHACLHVVRVCLHVAPYCRHGRGALWSMRRVQWGNSVRLVGRPGVDEAQALATVMPPRNVPNQFTVRARTLGQTLRLNTQTLSSPAQFLHTNSEESFQAKNFSGRGIWHALTHVLSLPTFGTGNRTAATCSPIADSQPVQFLTQNKHHHFSPTFELKLQTHHATPHDGMGGKSQQSQACRENLTNVIT